MTIEMEPGQVQNLLKYIDATQSEEVKRGIFDRLGRECFTAHRLDKWIETYRGNVQAFLDWVNQQQASEYWERLEYSQDGRSLILTGRVVEGCACAFANCPNPPLSLCHFCCKGFQEAVFQALLGQEVEVEITEAYMLGHQRCSTVIHIK
jgi:predicted hydrocarbon binding protein